MYKYTFLLSLLFLLYSCSTKEETSKAPEAPDAKQALEKDMTESLSLSKRGKDDIIERLYNELVSKSKPLQTFEQDLQNLREQKHPHIDQFNDYEDKSKLYYATANDYILNVKDSVLQKKVLDFIGAKEKLFMKDSEELKSLIERIDENKTSLNDRYKVMKIILTYPLMVQFQKEMKPGKEPFLLQIKEQKKTIQKIDSITTTNTGF